MISGETVRLLRNLKGIKQETVAKRLGISQPAYCKIEQCLCLKEERVLQILAGMDCNREDLEQVKLFVPHILSRP